MTVLKAEDDSRKAYWEAVFEALSQALEEVGQDKRDLFLAKLALALANHVDEIDQVRAAIESARRDLDAGGG